MFYQLYSTRDAPYILCILVFSCVILILFIQTSNDCGVFYNARFR
uniref:Uncharacterized protein n=1 Tax=Rhizophora mucronata TaxID=61149 RepID=A0A2P2PNG1_RHIMU